MTGFYDRLRDKTVFSLLSKYGVTGNLYVQTTTFDPVTGGKTVTATKKYSPKVLIDEYTKSDIDGTNVQFGDVRVYIEAKTLTFMPLPQHILEVGGVKYKIIRCTPTNPGGISVMWLVQGRK